MNRRAQQPISIRSDRAAARLRLLTRNGRSQAAIIEEALDRLPLPPRQTERAERLARIMTILERTSKRDIPSMAEFDRLEYDESGNPR